jgi:hypothetical protein
MQETMQHGDSAKASKTLMSGAGPRGKSNRVL